MTLSVRGLLRAAVDAVPGLVKVRDDDRYDIEPHHTVLALDTSPSMEEETDYPPNRLRAAKDAGISFVKERVKAGMAGSIGIVSFGDFACPALPLTSLEHANQVKNAINALEVIEGTNIAAGLCAALELFKSQHASGRKEVILLTDGGHNSEMNPMVASAFLIGSGCEIRIIGIGGTPEAVNEALLRRIASKDEDGKPLYRFIKDRDGLVRYFKKAGGLTR